MGVSPSGCYLRVDQSTRVLTLQCNNKALIKDLNSQFLSAFHSLVCILTLGTD